MKARMLADRVSELRNAQGMTQQALAERAQVSMSYVVLIEGGQAGRVSSAILGRLASVLGVRATELDERA